jgi:Domain of unknown function (DUF397)
MTGSPHPQASRWRKSSYSVEDNCFEIALLPDGTFAVRNSSDAARTVAFTRNEVVAFFLGVKAGEFDELVVRHEVP